MLNWAAQGVLFCFFKATFSSPETTGSLSRYIRTRTGKPPQNQDVIKDRGGKKKKRKEKRVFANFALGLLTNEDDSSVAAERDKLRRLAAKDDLMCTSAPMCATAFLAAKKRKRQAEHFLKPAD